MIPEKWLVFFDIWSLQICIFGRKTYFSITFCVFCKLNARVLFNFSRSKRWKIKDFSFRFWCQKKWALFFIFQDFKSLSFVGKRAFQSFFAYFANYNTRVFCSIFHVQKDAKLRILASDFDTRKMSSYFGIWRIQIHFFGMKMYFFNHFLRTLQAKCVFFAQIFTSKTMQN